ncbi:MAG: hypothetical protein KKH01_02130 [Firmicutes bacterium]|nr:hypothetical protein [Bacillota bacterium]
MKKIEGGFIILETFGLLGFLYSTYRDSSPKLYLNELPAFEIIYRTFMNIKARF